MHPVAGFLLDDADPVQLTTIGIAVLVAAPFGEELLFRGFLYRVLRQRFGPMPALLTTALLFALLHVAPHALLPYIGLGLAFGLIYEGVGSLWASIILHSLWNAVVFARILVVAAS
jgi:membrane protease YdiL (CAAX protease family)